MPQHVPAAVLGPAALLPVARAEAAPPRTGIRQLCGKSCLLRCLGLLRRERSCCLLLMRPLEGRGFGRACQPTVEDGQDVDGRIDVALPQDTEASSGLTEPCLVAAQHRRVIRS